MSEMEKTTDILGLMAEHEKIIGDLYRLYAEKLPKQSELFKRLANEEDRHQDALIAAREDIEKKNTLFSLKKFDDKVLLLKNSRDFIAKRIDKASSEAPAPDEALHTAAAIELSLFESGVFDDVATPSEAFKTAAATLKEDTKRHHVSLLDASKTLSGK